MAHHTAQIISGQTNFTEYNKTFYSIMFTWSVPTQ